MVTLLTLLQNILQVLKFSLASGMLCYMHLVCIYEFRNKLFQLLGNRVFLIKPPCFVLCQCDLFPVKEVITEEKPRPKTIWDMGK